MALFRKLNEEEGLTVILVTHDLEVARRANRALALIDGQVVCDTTRIEEAAEMLHRRAQVNEDIEDTAVTREERATDGHE
jgi:ABC-type lipoprotein export system ATPase subunit